MMRAALLEGDGVQFRPDYDPRRRESDVAIRVRLAGICETDLQLIRGYMGFQGVLGHEFVGVAEEGRYRDQRVVGEINCSCRSCEFCRRGLPTHCPQRSVVGILDHDGAFADYVFLPEENLHSVPDEIGDEEAVFVEPLAAAYQIPAQLDLSAFERCAVFGDGRLGNLCAQVLHGSGLPVTVIGKHAAKLQLLSSAGIETRLADDLPEGFSADLVVDCTGSTTGMNAALQTVQPRGVIVLKTTTSAAADMNLAPVVIDEVTVVGSRCGPFPRAITALREGEVDVTPLISARFPLEDIESALLAARTPPNLKVLLDI
jgi:threonine dehydrogenase-like Zn-dependent dehydrogenase